MRREWPHRVPAHAHDAFGSARLSAKTKRLPVRQPFARGAKDARELSSGHR